MLASYDVRLRQFFCFLFFSAEILLCNSFQLRSTLNVSKRIQTRFNLRPLYLKSNNSRNKNEDDFEESSTRANRVSRDDFEDQDDDSFELEDEIDRKMRDRFPNSKRGKPKSKTIVKDLNKWEVVNRAVLAGVFVAGIGSGITIDSAINTNPRDLASRDAIGASSHHMILFSLISLLTSGHLDA
jgi:F0F1-type ATP synthase assembly protein I